MVQARGLVISQVFHVANFVEYLLERALFHGKSRLMGYFQRSVRMNVSS
jgi:hypothetical protein